MMISQDAARNTIEFDDYFVIQPQLLWWNKQDTLLADGGSMCHEGFAYCSDTNDKWLSVGELREIVKEFCNKHPEYK